MEDTLTFQRIFARFRYWREFPPTHILVRALAVSYGAYKPEGASVGTEEMSDAQLQAAMS